MQWMIRCSLFLCILLSAPLCADDIRSWVDAHGTVHFGDKSAAPKDSEPVQLSPGSVVKMVPAPVRPLEPALPAPPKVAARHCTPVMRDYVDPKTGMHSERDTGRCEEDGNAAAGDEPRYYWGPCNGLACIRPPTPPIPPSSGPSMPNMGGTPLIPYR